MTKINLTVEQIDLNRREKVLLVYLQNEFAILNQIQLYSLWKKLYFNSRHIFSQHDVQDFLWCTWFAIIKVFFTDFFFHFFFGFNKYGPTLHYLKLEKKLTHLDIGSLRELFLFHTKKLRTFIYVNGYKFATFLKKTTGFKAITYHIKFKLNYYLTFFQSKICY